MWPLAGAVSCLVPLLLLAAEPSGGTITAFERSWRVPVPEDWRVTTEGGTPLLQLTVPRPSEKPRRPMQYALLDQPASERVTLEVEVRREPIPPGKPAAKSLILVYAWRDADHFNYAHLSNDRGDAVPYHNGMFHVYGGDRVRISAEAGPPALPTGDWHKVKLVYDGRTGTAEVFVDGQPNPALRAVDLSLGAGKVGLGSFFNTAQFRNLRVSR